MPACEIPCEIPLCTTTCLLVWVAMPCPRDGTECTEQAREGKAEWTQHQPQAGAAWDTAVSWGLMGVRAQQGPGSSTGNSDQTRVKHQSSGPCHAVLSH